MFTYRFLILVPLALASCGRHDRGDEVAATTLLEGNWTLGCTKLSGDADDSLIKVAVSDVGNLEVFEIQEFPLYDVHCVAASTIWRLTTTFTVGEPIADGVNFSTYKLDSQVVKVEFAYSGTSDMVEVNKGRPYGFSDWKTNVFKDVSGLRLTPTSRAEWAKGIPSYDIVQVKDDKRYDGDSSTGDGTTEAKRATKPLSRALIRQR